MKKLLIATTLAMVSLGAFAQGTIGFLNSSTTLARTNSSAGNGPAASAAGGFYYGVFTTPYNGVGPLPGAPLPTDLGTSWVFTGSYATNIPAVGRLSGGNNVPTATGWAAGETRAYVVAGWSSNLGHDWNLIQNQITTGAWANGNGFFGYSSIGFGIAGGGPLALPFFSLFGSGPTASGTPITAPFNMNVVPEPATFALAGLGAAALLVMRRRR
jgi:hypothetical protein